MEYRRGNTEALLRTRSEHYQRVSRLSDLETRSESSGSSHKCDNSSSECQKPVSDNSLAIGLAVGIPVFVILCVLGLLLYRTYRKDKKESMEYDPDFDETGEATALPDFPRYRGKMDDPFDNRHSLRYPMEKLPEAKKSSSSLAPTVQAEPYLDDFVLPYHHQTDSRASLDEYARQIGGCRPFGSSDAASGIITRTRNSSFSHFSRNSNSPQKSGLRTEAYSSNRSPTRKNELGKARELDARSENGSSNGSDSDHDMDDTNTPLNLGSDSNSEVSSDDVNGDKEKFAINYENESNLALNNTEAMASNSRVNEQNSEYDTAESLSGYQTVLNDSRSFGQRSQSTTSENTINDESDITTMREVTDQPHDITDRTETQSPEIAKMAEEDHDGSRVDVFADQDPESSHDLSRDFSQEFDQRSNQESNQELNQDSHQDLNDSNEPDLKDEEESQIENAEKSQLNTPGNYFVDNKTPRMSDFNLLKNDSDDENDLDPDITNEQEEEIKRMKSVYKVYFDRNNSMKESGSGASEPKQFQADPNHPLGDLPEKMDLLKINKELKSDTSYDKRNTVASSIYSSTPIFSSEEQQFYQNQQQFADNYDAYYGQPQFYQQGPSPQEQGPPVELPPLQKLPPPSEIRQSTIQTYTDYRPRAKKMNTINQGQKQPFVPIENGDVWSQPSGSPSLNQSPFPASQSSYSLNKNSPSGHTVPSASQLARSSVVMLNPVTEIPKHRKFTPAGSLPSGAIMAQPMSPQMGHPMSPPMGHPMSPPMGHPMSPPMANGPMNIPHSYTAPELRPEDDLVPGNRKSQIRKMMNTNF
ncbi:Piso0_005821 [Millerozyma farinosa CBS 7064]|uniref:Piso0_005821 protein n=1 Tax=Pichia sorbitophila (strain ATCC MYA-4447 / BCRC 22081 / CBS 7064 / NBRC 10061 / NRRL Y-12695) TaxID=559304 RepID=G8Y305_PICSO|nr:Piso0_005821 [Millerozyma farinosa CBS 7064]